MSHFTVLVIGNDPEKQLAPFHEFECTGVDDEYVQNVDQTEEARAEWESHKEDYPTLREFVEGWYGRPIYEEDETLAQSITDEEAKYGYAVFKGDQIIKLIRRTNPNSKWDWYLLGGRWSGFLKLKTGANGERGSPGLMTEAAPPDYADQALKRDIDVEGMRNEAEKKAAAHYDKVHAVIAGRGFMTWAEIKEKYPEDPDHDQWREAYHAQPVIKDLAKSKVLGLFEDIETFAVPREQYLKSARDEAISTFAVIKDGKWYERGEMGWWACVTNNKDSDDWQQEFNALLEDLPDDTLLSVFDCHI